MSVRHLPDGADSGIGGEPLPGAGEESGEGLAALYEALYLRLVRRVTWRFGISREDASEVVHDAFVIAIVKLDWSRNPKAWLYGAVDRLAINWKRKAGRRARLLAEFGPGSPFVDASGSGRRRIIPGEDS